MATLVMMRWRILIVVAVFMGLATVLRRVLGGAFVVAVMSGFVNHARRQPCENAEREKYAGEKEHKGLLNSKREMATSIF